MEQVKAQEFPVLMLVCFNATDTQQEAIKVSTLQCSNKPSYTTKNHKIVQLEKYHLHKYPLLQSMTSSIPV